MFQGGGVVTQSKSGRQDGARETFIILLGRCIQSEQPALHELREPSLSLKQAGLIDELLVADFFRPR